ncbi:MAG: PIN domain nuclease [Kineosporiaceae bacterium]|nr:PIN domain nuclease [Kineosporiaceae bacterium]MBK8076743.1 PIN domain nuclease [Kineosporiaceae bacterium]
MSVARFLIDTSGLARILQKEHRAAWVDFLSAGVIAVCPVVELEFLYSARSLADRLDKQRLLSQVFAWVPMADRAYERAAQIQEALTRRGEHRSAGAVDLLIAATAERHQLIVLSEDRDFETVAAVTGQPVRRITAL